MIRKISGFTLIELIIVMLMSGLILAAVSSSFLNLMSQSRVQSKIAESNESMIGFDMLKRDMESAGYGLAWSNFVTYSESLVNPFLLNDSPTNPPRPYVSRNNITTNVAPDDIFNGSDYLVIKSVNVAKNNASERWTYVRKNNIATTWSTAAENLQQNDRVIVIGHQTTDKKPLQVSGAVFYTVYDDTTNPDKLGNASFAPTDENDVFVVYGITKSNADPKRPFNRADYYISKDTSADIPSRCAPNTGILYKAVMNHDTNGTYTREPLIDCVADMQVIFRLDTNEDGAIDTNSNDISNSAVYTAEKIREQVKEVRVYILTHEGQKDKNYTHQAVNITVGEFGLGRVFNLGTNLNYRWKVYQLQIKSLNF